MGEPTFDPSIHDVLRDCEAFDDKSNIHGKSEFKRMVSMLDRLIQRSQSVAEDALVSLTRN